MFDYTELKDDLLVEEGHYLEKIQAEALEEAYRYHCIRDFESIMEMDGVSNTLSLLSPEVINEIRNYLQVNNAH
jgi:hypothetical protein